MAIVALPAGTFDVSAEIGNDGMGGYTVDVVIRDLKTHKVNDTISSQPALHKLEAQAAVRRINDDLRKAANHKEVVLMIFNGHFKTVLNEIRSAHRPSRTISIK